MNLRDLKQFNSKAIHSAGPRYTPGQDPGFPNLAIAELDDAFLGLIGGAPFRDKVDSLRGDLEERFRENETTMAAAFPGRVRKPNGCLNLLSDLASAKLGCGRPAISQCKRAVSRTIETYRKFENELYDAQSKRRKEIEDEQSNEDGISSSAESDGTLRKIDGQLHALRRYTSALRDVREFLFSSCCRAQYQNCVLMIGEWGSGKTHYLCDIAKNRISDEQPVLLVLAKDFEPHPSVGEALAKHTGLARSAKSLVSRLGRLPRRGQRALLIVDGINESDQKSWRDGVKELFNLVNQCNNVALIFSSRSPMHLGIVPDGLRKRMLSLNHPGFSEIEFDAQQSFFSYYEVPLPEVPMLADEFSRPLTLKILCEAFKSLPERTQRAGFAGLSSGQRGMTTILERFINERARTIEASLGLPGGFCWRLIKGDNRVKDALISGIAPHMASTRTNYASRDDVIRMIRARPQLNDSAIAERFYRQVLAEGLLVESELWRPEEEGGPLLVVRMPYERFGDHIVARHLLGKHLDTSSESAIRRSLYKNAPIGSLFETRGQYQYQYEYEGWIEALIVEFPERVKRTLPPESTELFFYLPKARQSLSAYWELFCNGLFWRHPDAFSRQTDKIAGTLLWGDHEASSRRIIDALVAVATKPSHPYNGSRLLKNLAKSDMVTRDLLWSEYLRTRFHSSSADRLVNWFERPISDDIKQPSASNLISIFSLFLTTTDRKLRDRVTKILVRLGEKYPKVLFERTLDSLGFNDPYVPERMLAACYGVAMSLWTERSNRVFRREILPFAKQLIRRIYLSSGDFRTPHVLVREYSLGLIEIAQLIHPGRIATQWISRTRRPFSSQENPFDSAVISEEVSEEAKSAIQMDFGNYTIGRLIPGRGNYDYDNADYVEVRGKIDWRICDLGYRKSLFEFVDQSIGRSSWRMSQGDDGKVDRYGKKYSWIAYFEMYGVRQAAGLLSDYRQDERTSDCDIDPSFPKSPADWKPPPHYFFRRVPRSNVDWIRRGSSPRLGSWLRTDCINGQTGPWVLLDGRVRDEDPRRLISSFAFLRGFLVDPGDVTEISQLIRQADYPTSGLPEPGEDHYTFAGEIPWSRRFAAETRTKSGGAWKYEPYDAFRSTRQVLERKRVKKAWQLVYENLGIVPDVSPIRFVPVGDGDEDEEQEAIFEAINYANSLVAPRDRIEMADLLQKRPTVEEIDSGFWLAQRWEQVSGYPVFQTSWYYSWESYHSAVNNFSGFQYPAPIICDRLGLLGGKRGVDLTDRRGQLAAIYRCSEERWSKSYGTLYLRKDLLDEFLVAENKSLVWVVWGERGFTTDHAPSLNRRVDIMAALQSHQHIFRRVQVYDPSIP